MCANRTSVLERARRCAALTLPFLLPEDGHNDSQELPTPYQSIGAEGVSTMASKLGLAYFNPSSPFLRLEADELALAQLAQIADAEMAEQFTQELNYNLTQVERAVVRDFDAQGHRTKMNNAIELLLATGNILQLMEEDGSLRIFRLDEFAVNRDRNGNLLELITEEQIALSALEPELEDLLRSNDAYPSGDPKSTHKTIKLHSYAKLIEKDRWELAQEINGVIIPDSIRTLPASRMPYNFVPLFEVPGDVYGRSLVEKVIGDLQTLETLSLAMEEGTVALSRLIIALRPGSVASPRELAEAPNTSIVVMDPEDAKAVQFEKSIDMSIALQWAQILTDRLEKSFLMMRSVQRSGERVTATEINALALEIESAHAGLQASIDSNLVRWTALRMIETLQRRKLIPKLEINEKSPIRPRVVTGFEGLGRAQDFQKIATVAQTLGATVPPEVLQTHVDWKGILKGLQTASGLDFDILLSDEEIQAIQEQAQQQAILQQAAAPIAREAAGALRDQAAPAS